MRLPNEWRTRLALFSILTTVSLALAGCGGSSSSSSSSGPAPSTTNNTQAIEVSLGPANNFTNGVFTSVTVCAPGTSNCQTIPNVLVDTGSEGLRLLSSQFSLSLPAITDTNGNALQECVVYGDGSYDWGSVVTADIKMAGETGSAVPIQVISTSPSFPVPSACTSGGGLSDDTVTALGANGILGVGTFQQDCGSACTSSAIPGTYYLCPGSACQATSVPLNDQLQNPVWTFPQDNNGLLISLPSIPDTGAQTVAGSMIFGIGTQSDNALGNAQIYTTDGYGDTQATYQNVAYSSFFDTGSSAIYFLDHATLGIPDCTDSPGLYCPGSTINYNVTNTGLNGTSGSVSFNVANADGLFNANGGTNAAFNDLGGDSGNSPSTDYFDFGTPFFFGRNVFIGIENQIGPGGVVGPYFAY